MAFSGNGKDGGCDEAREDLGLRSHLRKKLAQLMEKLDERTDK